MLPAVDRTAATAQQSVSHTLGLLFVSLSPFVLHLAGVVFQGRRCC